MIGEMDEDDSGTVDFEECVFMIIHKDVITVNIRIIALEDVIVFDVVIIDTKLALSLIIALNILDDNNNLDQTYPSNSIIDILDPLYNKGRPC